MMKFRKPTLVNQACRLVLVFSLFYLSHSISAAELRIAVASNFSDAIKDLAQKFEQESGHKVILIFGSTGKHYAQIKHGAPFDAFFAADAKRPILLDQEGIALPGSRFTYALGKLVLWSPKVGYVDKKGMVLEQGKFNHIAIANPKLAPYGKAAQEVLQKRGLWGKLRRRMVRGENIAQTYQFVKSGNAKLGFVAYSQVKRPGKPLKGSFWDIPPVRYSVIKQQAVLLKENKVGREFWQYIQSPEAINIIQSFGYGIP